MNDRIKQLTRTYLNNLPYYRWLDNDLKQRIIEINSQSEWIIFNAESLKSRRIVGVQNNSYRDLIENGGYSSETYDVISSTLCDIFKEVIKLYGANDLNQNQIEIKLFQFTGGSGNIDRSGHLITTHAIPLVRRGGGKGDNSYWVAVNKKVSGEEFESIFLNGDLCFNNSRNHWKLNNNLNNLLTDNEITNSRERNNSASSPSDSTRASPPPLLEILLLVLRMLIP